jgi:iron-sulfur cluster repair protein YtfE (RIC family)
MDATTLLKQDHDKVRSLLKRFEAAGDGAQRQKQELFEEIRTELEIHSAIEEEIFYPAVKALRTEEAEEIVDESMEEHAIVKRLLDELAATDADDETFDAKMKVLKENVEHHADEEEDEMFPEAKSGLEGRTLEELGRKMEQRKEALKSQLVGAR